MRCNMGAPGRPVISARRGKRRSRPWPCRSVQQEAAVAVLGQSRQGVKVSQADAGPLERADLVLGNFGTNQRLPASPAEAECRAGNTGGKPISLEPHIAALDAAGFKATPLAEAPERAGAQADSDWWAQIDLWLVRAFHRIPSYRKTSDPAFFHDPQDLDSGLIGGDGSLPGFGGASILYPVLLSEGCHKRGVSLQRVAELVSANPARNFGLYPRKGAIAKKKVI